MLPGGTWGMDHVQRRGAAAACACTLAKRPRAPAALLLFRRVVRPGETSWDLPPRVLPGRRDAGFGGLALHVGAARARSSVGARPSHGYGPRWGLAWPFRGTAPGLWAAGTALGTADCSNTHWYTIVGRIVDIRGTYT